MAQNKRLTLDEIWGADADPKTSSKPAGTQETLNTSVAPMYELPKSIGITPMATTPIVPEAKVDEALEEMAVENAQKEYDEQYVRAQVGKALGSLDIKTPKVKGISVNPSLSKEENPLDKMIDNVVENRKYIYDTIDEDSVRKSEAQRALFDEYAKQKVGAGTLMSGDDLPTATTLADGEEVYSFGTETLPKNVVDEYLAAWNDDVLHEKRFKEDAEYRNEWMLRHTGKSERRYREELADELEARLNALKKDLQKGKQTSLNTGLGYAAIGAAANKPSSGATLSVEKIDKALEVVNTLRKNNFGAGFAEGFDLGNILTLDLKDLGINVALIKALNKDTRGEQLNANEKALVEAWSITQDAEEAIETLGGRSRLANIGRGSAQSLGFITQMAATGGLASAATKGISRAAAKVALKRAMNTAANKGIGSALKYGSLKVAESAVGAAARVPFSGFIYKNYTDKRLNQFQLEERFNEATGKMEKVIGKQETSALRDAVRSALESFFEFQSEDVGGWFDYSVKAFAKALPRTNLLRRIATEGVSGPVKGAIPRLIKDAGKIYSLGGEVLSEAYGDAMVNTLTGDSDGWKQMATADYWWELAGVSAMLSGGFAATNRVANRVTGVTKYRNMLKKARVRALGNINNEALRKHLIEASSLDDLAERSKMLASLDWGNTLTREDMANAIDFIQAQTKLDVADYSEGEANRLARMVPFLEKLSIAARDGEISYSELQENVSRTYTNAFRVQENQEDLARIYDRVRLAAEVGVSANDINNIVSEAGLTIYNVGDDFETLSGIKGIVNRVLPAAYEAIDEKGNIRLFQFEEVLQPSPEVREAQLATTEQTESAEAQAEPTQNATEVAVEEAKIQARNEADKIKNEDDGKVYEATLTDGTPVYIVKGTNIVYDDTNGEVDYEKSEATVVVQMEDGSRRQVSIRDIDSIDEVISVEEVAEVAGQTMQAAIETAQQAEQTQVTEGNSATEAPADVAPNPMIGRSLSDEEANAVILRMEENATVAPELELTPENWDEQFGEDGIVATPIGDVKMGENQYLKMSRQGRDGKLGMVKPTLTTPDIIVEEKSSAGDGAVAERNSSFVFLKAFTNTDGSRMYKFASVTIRKDGREVVISNQEKETPRIKRLLKEGMLTYISDATLPSESTASTQGVQPTIPGGATLSDNKNTTSEPQKQEVEQKNVAAPEIPTLKNGQPDYNAMSPEMFVEQYSAALGADKTELVARNNIKADNKAIADIEKKIAAITDPNKLPELDAKLEAVKAHKARYVSVLGIMGLSEAVEDNSTRQNRLRKDFAGRMTELFPGGFPNVESLILYDVATGAKFRWEDKETNGTVVSRGLGAELGLSAADAERKRRIGLLASDAPTPEEYAEQLRERLDAQGIRYDETELRDKVIDVLSSVDTVGSARKALEQLAASLNQEEEALDYEDEQARRAYERERQGLANEDGSYKLSSEVDENGRQFVLSSSGNVEFGEISEESGLPPAPILLSEGMITNKATNDGYGLVHIEARHGDQIRKAGYKSVVDFIEDVARNYEVIKEGNVRDGNNTYLLQITDKHNNTLMVELSGDGTYWNINTAGIFKTSYGKNRREVYNRHTTAKQPAETDEASRNAEPSGTQADPSMITTSTLNSSDNKNTTSAPNNQEVAQKKVDDPGLIGDEELSVEDETPFAIADEAVPADSSAAAQLATEAAIMALEDAGAEVVEATPEMVEEALQRRDIRMQTVEQQMSVLQKAERFIRNGLTRGARGSVFRIPLPDVVERMIRNVMGRDFDSHNITINSIVHALRNHGVNGTKLTSNSIALTEEDATLIPYIMFAPDRVEKAPTDASGRESVRFYKELSNGYVVVVEKEYKNSPDDMETITMWAEISPKATNARQAAAPDTHARNAILSTDAAKIRKDAENAIRNDVNLRFSIGPAPVFVSNAKIAVMGIKQEKATPEQWLKMIEKAGGLKAGEDKWLGLSDWLKDSEKKTLTKKEVLDYINENQIQIEEARYSSDSAIEATPEFAALRDEYRSILRRYEDEARRNLEEFEERMAKKYGFSDLFDTTALNDAEGRAHITLNRAISDAYLGAWGEMWDKYGDDFDRAFIVDFGGLRVNKASDARRLLHLKDDAPIYHLREEYTTRGLNGNREIALTVPTIAPWNTSDEVHFGDAGGGRAIAWIRFGETTDSDGKRVLAIDEIQSKRHQEGREKGYISGDIKAGRAAAKKRLREAYDAAQEYRETLKEKYNWDGIEANSFSERVQKLTALLTPEEIAERERLDEEKRKADEEWDKYDRVRGAVPEAPFDKNWAELAMKRMLRYAAENGYDKVAWTTGEQQAERYSLGAVLQGLKAYKTSPNTYYVVPYNNGAIGEFVKEYTEKELADTFGKELAAKIIANTEDATEDNPYEIEGDNLRIGGEGMKGFYDQILPSFMNKYGKKWGATVQDVTLPNVEEVGRTMHSVDITDSMRESVMQGQPMFYRRPNGIVYGWTNGKTVYLTPEGMNPNTPIHEYTHIWADAMRKNNPKGWESIVKLLKGTPVWSEVVADANYANIKDNDNQVASETLSRLSGRNNAAKMEAMAQQILDEGGNDSVKKNRARKLLDCMRKALQEFWSWVGKDLFGIEKFESIDEVTDRVLYDLVSGTDLGAVPAEGIHMDQQLTADKSFIRAYDSAFDELSSEYDALDKTDEAALKTFRAKKLDLVERYMSSMSSNLAMPTAPVIVDASDPDSVKKAYELLPDEYRKFVTFDAFIDEVSSAVGFYVADSKMSVYNISNDDTLNSSREWLGILAHENGHKAVETLGISDSDKEKLWEFCKRTTTSVRKKIEKDYESAAERGEEYLVYTIQSRARYPRLGDLLAECIMGEKTAQDVVKTFKDSLPLRDEIVEKILNYFRDGYRKARGEADYSAAAGRAKSKEEVQGFYNRFRGEYSQGLRRDNSVGRDLDDILFSIGEQPLAPASEEVKPTEEDTATEVDIDTTAFVESEKTQKALRRLNKVVRQFRAKMNKVSRENIDWQKSVADALEKEVGEGQLRAFLEMSDFVSGIRSAISEKSVEKALETLEDKILTKLIAERKQQLKQLLEVEVQRTTPAGIPIAFGVDNATRQVVDTFNIVKKLGVEKAREYMAEISDDYMPVPLKAEVLQLHALWSMIQDEETHLEVLQQKYNRAREESVAWYHVAKELKDVKGREKEREEALAMRRTHLAERRRIEPIMTSTKQQAAEDYASLVEMFADRIMIGRDAQKRKINAEREYARRFSIEAWKDVEVGGKRKTYERSSKAKQSKKKWERMRDIRLSMHGSLKYMIESVSINAISGRGFIYKEMIEGDNGWIACRDNELTMNVECGQSILNRAKEAGFKSVDDMRRAFDDALMTRNGEHATVTYKTERTGRQSEEKVALTVGNATYLVLMWNQPDIRPTLEKMNIDEATILQLYDMLPKYAQDFIAWSVDMLEQRLEKVYNPASVQMYGTSMDKNLNYFPVRRVKEDTYHAPIDISDPNMDNEGQQRVTNTSTALIRRKPNLVSVEILVNPLEVLGDHLEEMNHFAAFVPFSRNANILLSADGFREQLEEQKGTGHGLNTYDDFKRAVLSAAGNYKPKTTNVDAVVREMQGLVAVGKIAWRFFTAAKQILSLPAFVSYSTDPKYWRIFAKTILNSAYWKRGESGRMATWKWCYENLPTFKERWDSKYAGDEKLSTIEATAMARALDRSMAGRAVRDFFGKYGMLANAGVDAFTCSIGAYAIYEYELQRFQKEEGMSRADAEKMAKRRAEIGFNQSQQSSEKMFLAPLQLDRTFAATYASLFENSNRAYGRIERVAREQIARSFDKEAVAKQLDLATRRYAKKMRDAERARLKAENEKIADFHQRLTDEQIEEEVNKKRGEFDRKARMMANADMKRAKKNAISDVVIFRYMLNTLWAISPSLAMSVAFIGSDDDDENPESWDWKFWAMRVLQAHLRNGVGGATIEAVLNGFGVHSMLETDLNKIVDAVSEAVSNSFDAKAVDWQAFGVTAKLMFSIGLGVNIDTFINMYNSVCMVINDGSLDAEDVLTFLNAPKNVIEMSAIRPDEGESQEDYIRRIAFMKDLAEDVVEAQRKEELNKKGIVEDLTDADKSALTNLKKWQKNYIAVKTARALNLKWERNRMTGRVEIPELKELEERYSNMLDTLGLTPSLKMKDKEKRYVYTPDEQSRINDAKARLNVMRRLRNIRGLEKGRELTIVKNDDYEALTRQWYEAKKSLVDDWNNIKIK